MSANSLTIEMTQDLYRLMLCLASADRQSVLFDRLSDEDEELEDDGVTEELALAGISWWKDNEGLIKEIANKLTSSLLKTASENALEIGTFFDHWGTDSWSDFISESFDCIWNFGDDNNFDYFFDYAVKQSLGFNIGSGEGQDSHGARGIEISTDEWVIIAKLFKAFWWEKDIFEIFVWVHEKSKNGISLMNL